MDWTFRLGDLTTIMSFLGVAGVFLFRAGNFTAAIKTLQKEVRALQEAALQMATTMTTIAVQKNEMEHMRLDIDDLKRGRGFIHDDINREYPR